jgi:hypothetical protein
VFDVRSRRVAVALVTLVASGALAACGSASSSSTTSSTTASASSGSSSGSSTAGGGAASGPNSAKRAQLVSCLKSHGVTLPARPAGAGAPPGAGGGSGTGTTGTGTTPRRGFFFGGGGARNISPKMQAAFKACGANFGFRGGAGGFRGRISHTAITSFVTCVKQHGYNLPSPNFSGKGPIFPQSVETNAKFQAAAKSCSHLLIPARPSGGSSGGTSTTSGA